MRRLFGAGLAALVLMIEPLHAQAPAPAPAATDWTSAEAVEIDLTNFAFTPATLMLRSGAVYRLHFVNKASGGHDFTAKAFFGEATIDPEDQAVVQDGAVRLSGGQTADLRLTAPKAGTYEVHCSHFMHAGFGMKGQIVVQ
jgi:uncharacterized cupredoxin-like copper-binding protein